MTATGTTGRLWYLQWIRGYAMLLGVPFHVGLIYSTGTPWFVTSPEKSAIVTAITGWLTSFRMPLFFYVAGLLSAAALAKRGPRVWLMRRLERLGVPLLASTLVIGPAIFAAMAYAGSRGAGARPFRVVFNQFAARPGAHWIGHLWFLQVLLFYSLIAVVALPALTWLRPRLVPRDASGRLAVPLPWVFLAAAAVILYGLGEKGGFAAARSWLHFQGDPLWEMLKLQDAADFLPFFLIGIFMHDVRLPAIHRSVWAWSIIGIAMLFTADHWNEPGIADKVIHHVCSGILAILGGCMILDLSSRLVTGNHRVTEYLAGSAFTVYLFHYPIVVWLGTVFDAVHWDPLVEYLLLISLTLALTFMAHAVVSRSRTLTYLFNGERRASRVVLPAVDPARLA